MSDLIKSVKIDHKKIIDCITYQMQKVFLNPNYSIYFEGIKNIYIDDEQNFLKRKDFDENAIFLVIHFGDSALEYATSAIAVVIKALGSANAVEPTRSLLTLFAQEYNAQYAQLNNTELDYNMIQRWNHPTILQNFIEVDTDFRNFSNLVGTFIITENTIDITPASIKFYYDDTNYEQIDFFSFNDNLSNSTDPQVFYDSKGKTRTEVKFGTYSFGISIRPIESKLYTKILNMIGFEKESEEDNVDVNDIFKFSLVLNDGRIKTSNFKLVNFNRVKNKREELSLVSLAFSE